MSADSYDVIVIGGGAVGGNVAERGVAAPVEDACGSAEDQFGADGMDR